jgi:predicted RNA binding protein YcfA (HicA-like mRNA interferase family)
MPELPVVSGQQVINALREIGYETVGQKGSHIKMRRFYEDNLRVDPIKHSGKRDCFAAVFDAAYPGNGSF